MIKELKEDFVKDIHDSLKRLNSYVDVELPTLNYMSKADLDKLSEILDDAVRNQKNESV